MKKEEIKFNEKLTRYDVELVGLRFMTYTIKRLFENDNLNQLNWDLNVTTLMTILNRMKPENQEQVMGIFNNFFITVSGEQIKEFKSIFLPEYNKLMEEIQPESIVTLIGDGFDDEVDDFVYGNDLLF